ncbi:alpha/beta hydrolase [Rhodoplanes sp. Z2-YC6860]|uniref:alpha/beta hydrolase n=1 Tax=Rhodoplanes sp. Z2-YC6860 TaxID=674703 RepID=UPI00078C530A|nr:alpha/beta hydrolase [Rhodoplanes sp. Z2-YC6860]AMN38797.1 lipase/esterase [Rhodoplanes sp. Z2-YC6860]
MRRRQFLALVGGAVIATLGGGAVYSALETPGVSVASRLLRLVLRFVVKGRDGRAPDIGALRHRMDSLARIFPGAPKNTKATALDAGGVSALRVVRPESRDGYHVLYLHGGAYVFGSPSLYRNLLWRIARATRAQVLFVNYRLAPEHPFPAALDDAVTAYRWLLADGADPSRIIIMGDSAGGGLAVSALLRLRDAGIALPAATVMMSPWTDLAVTGESNRVNAASDPLLEPEQARYIARLYLAGADPRSPDASPLYGDPAGLPRSLIQVGSDEIMLDDSVRMAQKMRAAGVDVELEVWPLMPHAWHVFAGFLPESRRAIEKIGTFVNTAFASAQRPYSSGFEDGAGAARR